MIEEHLVIGDVQGCHQELVELLAAAKFDPARQRLAFVGDLINRGPDSRGVLELAKRYDARVVVGNHEDALLSGQKGQTLDRVRAQLGAELASWVAWIRSWPTFQRVDDGGAGFILVHA